MTTPSLRTRVLLIDVYKSLAAQLIVLHHFAWYGPLAENAARVGPQLDFGVDWLAAFGRYAVAVFIAVGGFLSAQSLPMRGLRPEDHPFCLIRDRYLRLVGPFAVALLFAMACTWLARPWLHDEALGSPPDLMQFIAHLLLLHTLLGVESLSAGVWYVAIDFQLYALLVLLLWLAGHLSRRLPAADFAGVLSVTALATASLFWFNRHPDWDVTGFYFFGAYALGVLGGWAIRSERRAGMLLLILVLGVAALVFYFRPRVTIALAIVLTLGCSRLLLSRFEMRLVHYLGGTSYALFLVHFPVLLLVSAVFEHYRPGDPLFSTLGLFVAWLASMAVADQFHRRVELPYEHWRKRRILCRSRLSAAPAGIPAAPVAFPRSRR